MQMEACKWRGQVRAVVVGRANAVSSNRSAALDSIIAPEWRKGLALNDIGEEE